MIVPVPPYVQSLARRLPAPLFLVGGYVRNVLLWGAPVGTDVDVCGPMTVDEVAAALDGVAEVIPVNPRVGTVLVRYEGADLEYTTFRRDSYPIGGVHTPDKVVFVSTVDEDALRRDFRVNALYANALTGEVIDVTGGLTDLENRVINTTREAAEVFAEDGLRILRMVRFCAELGFAPHRDALAVARAMRDQLDDITPERKREELDKILLADVKYGVSDAPQKGADLLGALGVWPHLLGQDADRIRLGSYPPVLAVRLAALCRQFGGEDSVTFAQTALGKLRYPNRTMDETCRLLQGEAVPQTESEWRLWAAEYERKADEICALWQNEALRDKALRTREALRVAQVPRTHKDLPLSPAEIEALGVPKRELGRVMKRTVDYCVVNLLCPSAEECVQIVRKIKGENKWN